MKASDANLALSYSRDRKVSKRVRFAGVETSCSWMPFSSFFFFFQFYVDGLHAGDAVAGLAIDTLCS